MRSKFELNEGEVQRILSLHKKAINEQLFNLPSKKNILTEQESYIQKNDHDFYMQKLSKPPLDYNNPLNFSMLGKNKPKWEKTKSGAVAYHGKAKVYFKCEGKNNYDFLVKWTKDQQKTYWHKSEKLGKFLRGKFCKKQGTSNENPKKEGYAYTYVEPIEGPLKLEGGNMYFRCTPYNKQNYFKLNKDYFENKPLSDQLIKVFCKKGESSYSQMSQQNLVSDNSGRQITFPKGKVWKWKSSKPNQDDYKNTGDENSLTSDRNNNYSGTDGQNTQTQDPNEVLKSGFSDGNSTDRSLTLSCDNAEFAAKSCNDRSLRAQITINDNCDDTILNDAIQNFSKGVTGVKGALVLIEDGVWGETSKAAWEACKTNMRQGTSGSSGQSGSNGSAGSAGSAGTNGSSGSVGVQGGEDLKLTDAEYVKLTS